MQHATFCYFIIFCDKKLSFQVDILHVGNFLPPFCPLHVGKHFGVCQHFANKSYKNVFSYAAMTELVDVSDLKSEAGFSVRVRFPLAAPSPKDSCDYYRRRFFYSLTLILPFQAHQKLFLPRHSRCRFYRYNSNACRYPLWFDKWNVPARLESPATISFFGIALSHTYAANHGIGFF